MLLLKKIICIHPNSIYWFVLLLLLLYYRALSDHVSFEKVMYLPFYIMENVILQISL